MNYEFNLLHRVGVVAKRVRAAAATETAAAHERDDNTPSRPIGRGVKTENFSFRFSLPPLNPSEIRRPVDDLSFDSRH